MNPASRLVNYLRASRTELEKVAWPSRQDVTRYSVLIIGTSLVAAIFFAVLDTGLQAGIQAAISGRPAPVTQQPAPVSITPEDLQVVTSGTTPTTVTPMAAPGAAPTTENVITGTPIKK